MGDGSGVWDEDGMREDEDGIDRGTEGDDAKTVLAELGDGSVPAPLVILLEAVVDLLEDDPVGLKVGLAVGEHVCTNEAVLLGGAFPGVVRRGWLYGVQHRRVLEREDAGAGNPELVGWLQRHRDAEATFDLRAPLVATEASAEPQHR